MSRFRDRGQSIVEFALIFPILMLLVVGIFDAGRAVYAYTTLDQASKTGARVAIVNQSQSTNCAFETAKCAASSQTTGLGVTPGNVTVTSSCTNLQCPVTVTVTYQYRVITPIVGLIFPNINMSVSTTMRIERQYANP